MASMLLTAKSGKAGSSTVTILDGAGGDTGYRLIGTPDFGNASWDVLYSGPRGTQGARAAGAVPTNRVIAFSIRITGSTKDDALAKFSTLVTLADELRRFGGTITWRSKNQTYRQHFDVMSGNAAIDTWSARSEHSNLIDCTISAACSPFLRGDPMDVFDDFSTDSITAGNYAFDSGAAGNVAVAAGELDAVANLTTEDRAIHTAFGYTYGDHQVTIKHAPGATLSGYKVGVVLKRIDANNYLEGVLEDDGTTSRLRLYKIVAGVRTQLFSTNLGTRIAASAYEWIRGRIEGNVVAVERWRAAVTPLGPTPMATPDTLTDYTLTAAEAATFGIGIEGRAGFVWTPQHTDAKLDDFDVDPFTRRNVQTPEDISFNGSIPGDASATAELVVTAVPVSDTPRFAAFGWWPRVRTWNYVWNGDFENNIYVTPFGWSVAAVTNINAAATSISLVSESAMFGSKAGEIVTPATLDSGTNFAIYRRFKRGIPYTFDVWVRAPVSTTNVYARIGNSAANDKADSSAVALSTTKQKLTVTWRPSADRDVAHIAVNVAAATATTFRIDAAQVYEGTSAPTLASQTEGRGGAPAVGLIEGETALPTAGFNWTITATASGRLGYRLEKAVASGVGGSITGEWLIDTNTLDPDEFTQGEYEFETYARLTLPSTMSTVTAQLRAQAHVDNSSIVLADRFTEEWGSPGRALPIPGSTTTRLYRLGTLRLPIDVSNPQRWRLMLILTYGVPSANGTVALDYLFLLPMNSRALTPTGKPHGTGYPVFIGEGTVEVTKRIKADLSGVVSQPPNAPFADHGLGGSLLELPLGKLDCLLKLANIVPDDTSNSIAEVLTTPATVHLAVTPRWAFARSS